MFRLPTILLWLLLAAFAEAAPEIVRVHVSGGDGRFPSLQAAIDAAPEDDSKLYEILLHPGTHRGKVHVPDDKGPIRIVGRNAKETTVWWDDSADTEGPDGEKLGTFRSATLTVESDDFSMENITIENGFGQGSQAVALRISGDRGVFRNCRFLGWQDTLLVEKKRQYFAGCEIAGHVDFIFGASAAWFGRCVIRCLGNGYVTAASTPEDQDFGLVFSKCRVEAAPEAGRVFLGRPWRPHASTFFLECELPPAVVPAGWDPWGKDENKKTARYGEWRTSGQPVDERVDWSRQLADPEGRGMVPAQVLRKWDPEMVISLERIARLPEKDREPWLAYLRRSEAAHAEDEAVLARELEESGSKKPARAPKGQDFRFDPPDDRSWFRGREARDLCEAIVSFQLPSGGWSKAVSYDEGPREPGMFWTSQNNGWHYAGTIDNNATIAQLRFLATVVETRSDSRAKAAFDRGLSWVFNAQYPNGGWPQVWPLEGGYHDHVTFNDGGMIRVMEFLGEVAGGKFRFVDAETRKKAASAVDAGVRCILDAQYIRDGKRTVWGAQHEPLGLQPAPARLQEPRSLSGGESADIVRYLQEHAPRSAETADAIRAAIDWFESAKLTGIRRVKKEGRNYYETRSGDRDPWWPRFADLETDRPIFGGSQDGFIYDDFDELWRNNPTEYAYFVNEARKLIGR